MSKFDEKRREFFKWSLIGLATLFLDFSGLGKISKVFAVQPDQIGLLYSTATGIVLRTINPGKGEQAHLNWVDAHKPAGTALLRINKSDIGADHKNCPNLDTLIPYVKNNKGINLDFGKSCAIVGANSKVVDVVLCCPVLYQAKLSANIATSSLSLIQKQANIGDTYDSLTGVFTTPKVPTI